MRRILPILLLLCLESGESNAQQINTTGGGTLTYAGIGQTVDISPRQQLFGVGQGFAAPAGSSYLNSFTMFVAEDYGQDKMRYTTYVAAYNPSTSTLGSVIWNSPEWASPTAPLLPSTLAGFQALNFLPNVSVTPGAAYMAFIIPTYIAPIVFDPPPNSGGAVQMKDADVVAAIQRNGPCCGSYVAFIRSNWAFPPYSLEGPATISDFVRSPQAHLDVAFIANFSNSATVVPEPGTYGMIAVGLVAIGGVHRRRKRNLS